jgi:hypothetical protein
LAFSNKLRFKCEMTFRTELWLAIAAMGSGAALIVAIFAKTMLALTLPLSMLFVGLLFLVRYSRCGYADRLNIRARARTGFAAGMASLSADVGGRDFRHARGSVQGNVHRDRFRRRLALLRDHNLYADSGE